MNKYCLFVTYNSLVVVCLKFTFRAHHRSRKLHFLLSFTTQCSFIVVNVRNLKNILFSFSQSCSFFILLSIVYWILLLFHCICSYVSTSLADFNIGCMRGNVSIGYCTVNVTIIKYDPINSLCASEAQYCTSL